jgi:hypothetical protein
MAKIAGIGYTAPKRKVKRAAKPMYGPPVPKAKPVAGPQPSESRYYPAQVRRATRKQYAQTYGHQPTGTYEHGIARGTTAGPSVAESKTVVRRGRRAKQAAQTVQSLASRQKTTGAFQPQDVRNAIASGLAPNIHEGAHGVFLVKHQRRFLPDAYVPVAPKGVSQAKVMDAAGVQEQSAAYRAPVLKVLEQTTRPIHAIAGAATAAMEGKSIGHAAGEGFLHNKPYSFSRVLKDLGAPKIVQGPGGFVLDVFGDPTTYVTFGAASVAEHAALAESARVAAKAAEAGMSEQGIRTVAQRAGQRAAANARGGKALTVRFGSKGSTKTIPGTAFASRVAQKAKPPGGEVARNFARDVRPSLAPTGADQAQFQGVRSVTRGVRSQTQQALTEIDAHARGLHSQIGPDNYEKVIHAIETRKVHKLPPELKQAAVFLRSQFRHASKLRRQAGLAEGTIRDYFPHVQADTLNAGKGIDTSLPPVKPSKRGGKIIRPPSSASKRTITAPIAEANPVLAAEGRGQFSTDIPLVYSNYQRDTLRNVLAPADLAKKLTEAGRPIKPGKQFELKPGERVYRLGFESPGSTQHVVGATKNGGAVVVKHPSGTGKFGLRPLSDGEQQALANPAARHAGQYVALDERVVKDAEARSAPAQESSSQIGRAIDKTTRTFKAVATATPGFHARNLVGDVQMGYLSQPGHALPGNLAAAAKALKGIHAQQQAAEKLAFDTAATGKTIKIAGQRVPVEQFLGMARQHGVIQSGRLTRELVDLGAKGVGGVKKAGRVRSAGRAVGGKISRNPAVKALMQDRENLVRLATFKHGLDSGMNAGDAASLSLGTHIDYGDLTEFERKYARRVMPFYTFTARALPFHVQRLLTRPGKFANIEKAREQIGGTDVSGYSPYTQRQVPFNVGKTGVTDALPLNVLNEVPTSAKHYPDELFQFGMGLVNPVLKAPIEYGSNRSFTFRNDIQDPKRPLVSAPSWVAGLPQATKKQMGIVQGPDKKTGKRVWLWPGKVDYAVRQVALGPFNAASQIATVGAGRTGQSQTEKAAAALTGVRVTPSDKVTQQINRLYQQLNGLTEKQAALGQQGIHAKNPTPAYTRLKTQIHATEVQIYNLAKKRGDKVLPKAGAPSRARGGGSVGGGFGGFGGGFGGGFN